MIKLVVLKYQLIAFKAKPLGTNFIIEHIFKDLTNL